MEDQFSKASWGEKIPKSSDEKVWVYSTAEHRNRCEREGRPPMLISLENNSHTSEKLENATGMKPVGNQGRRLVNALAAAFEQRELNGVSPFNDQEIKMFVEGWTWADNDAMYEHQKRQTAKPEPIVYSQPAKKPESDAAKANREAYERVQQNKLDNPEI